MTNSAKRLSGPSQARLDISRGLVLTILSLFGLALPLTGQIANVQERGLLDSLLRVSLTPANDPLASPGTRELAVVNTSNKDVVAFSISVETISVDGSSHSEGVLNIDLVPSIPTAIREQNPTVNSYIHVGVLHPGERMVQPFGGPSQGNIARVIRPQAVVFDDNSSAGDAKQIDFFFTFHADAAARFASELSQLPSVEEEPVRAGLLRWKQGFKMRDFSAPESTKFVSPGAAYAQSHFAAWVQTLESNEGRSDDSLNSWFSSSRGYLEDLASSFLRHSVKGVSQ